MPPDDPPPDGRLSPADVHLRYRRQQEHRRELQFALARGRSVTPAGRTTVAIPVVEAVPQVPIAGPAGPHVRLRAEAGIEAGTTFELRLGTLGVGRAADNAVRIDDPTVSSHHASLQVSADMVTVDDLGSLNGTLVNGSRLEGSGPLAVGDSIQVGGVVLVLEDSLETF